MYLVYEQHVIFVEVGQDRGQVSRPVYGRPRRYLDVDAQLIGYDACKGGLTQPRRPVKQHVVEGLVPEFGRLDKYAEVVLGVFLTYVVVQSLRSQSSFLPQLSRTYIG